MEIKKVLIKDDGTKHLVVPRKSEIQAGDYVKIELVDEKQEEQPQWMTEVIF